MKKVKLLSVMIVLIISISTTACAPEKDVPEKQGKPLLYVELSSPYSPSYFISLDDNKTYNIQKSNGEKGETLDSYINGTLKDTESKTVEISSSKYEEIVSLISKLNTSTEKNNSIAFWEAWNVTVSIDNNEKHFVFGDAPNEYYDLIVGELIELAPMNIVDSNENSVSKVKYEE